jgi:hypothetical protein
MFKRSKRQERASFELYEYQLLLISQVTKESHPLPVINNSALQQLQLDTSFYRALCNTLVLPQIQLIEHAQINNLKTTRIVRTFSHQDAEPAVVVVNALKNKPLKRWLSMNVTAEGQFQMKLLENQLILKWMAKAKPRLIPLGEEIVEEIVIIEELIDATAANATSKAAEFVAFSQNQIENYENGRQGLDDASAKISEAETLKRAIEASISTT